MNKIVLTLSAAALAAVPALATQPPAAKQTPAAVVPHTERTQLILYEMTNYNGDSWTVEDPSTTVHTDWNIRSVAVHPGDRWQICARTRFRDPCIILDRSVPDATMIGIDAQIGSARPAPEGATNTPAPR